MDKQDIIDEFSELLNIPQFQSIILHKISELKLLLQDEIMLYMDIREKFHRSSRENLRICDDDGKERGQTYRFELNLDEQGQWNASCIDPKPPTYMGANDVVPPEVITHMSSYKPDPGTIHRLKEFETRAAGGRTFELSFTRYSHHHLLGTVCEIKTRPETPFLAGSGTGNIIDINDSYKNAPEYGNYKELIFYMEKFPKFKAHIFSEFFLKWKLLIDNQIVEANAD